jgi:hypothetical protein
MPVLCTEVQGLDGSSFEVSNDPPSWIEECPSYGTVAETSVEKALSTPPEPTEVTT